MSITETRAKRQNRTVVLHVGNTLAEYESILLAQDGVQTLIQRVEMADSLNWGHLADGHQEDCPRHLHFTHHDAYTRTVKHFDGTQSVVTIFRVRCLECEAVFTILPSFIVRYKRYDTDAIEKLMTLLFITEDSYRMARVSQALGQDTQQAGTWMALEEAASDAISPMALWGLVQWFGQLSPAQMNYRAASRAVSRASTSSDARQAARNQTRKRLNLALGVEPPTHVIEDEKHMKECGEKTYVPIVYAPKEALIWWIDYVHSVSEDALRDSLERFKALSERLTHLTGATVDGWDPAQHALQGAFPGLTLEECHLHAMLKFGEHLATFKRQRRKAGQPISEQEETHLRDAFLRVLQAPTPAAYQQALDELPAAFSCEPLASRKDSLVAKQTLFQAWTTDDQLAVVTTALGDC